MIWSAFLPPTLVTAFGVPIALVALQVGYFAFRGPPIAALDWVILIGLGATYSFGLALFVAPVAGLLGVVKRWAGRAFWLPVVTIPLNLALAWWLLGDWVEARHAALAASSAHELALLGHPHGPAALVALLLLPIVLLLGLLTGGWTFDMLMYLLAWLVVLLVGLGPSVTASTIGVVFAALRGAMRRNRDVLAEPEPQA